MDPVYVSMAICAVGLMICGVLAGRIFGHLIFFYKHFRDRNNYPRLVKKNWELDLVCKPHSWSRTKLALTGLEPGPYLVCMNCGSISGHDDVRLNDAAIEVLKNNIKLNNEKYENEKASIDRMKEILTADREYWIKTFGREFGKDEDTNRDLLEKFSKFTVESVEAAGRRAIEEFKGKI